MYIFISYENNVCKIQVDGCVLQTLIDVPLDIVQDSPEWVALLEREAQNVLNNMDVNSPTYDPALTGN